MGRLNRQEKRISLREFANISCLDMLDYCEGRRRVVVIDDEGNEAVSDTLLMSFTWFGLILHRHFNDEPYLNKELIDLSGKDGYSKFIDDKLLTKPLEVFIPVVMLKHDDPNIYDLVKQLNYVHQNLMHNYLSILGEPAVVSIRAIDIAIVYDHPKIQEIKKDRRERKITTEVAMKLFDKILVSDSLFDKSLFVLLYRTKGLDKIQSYNLLIERGPVFDLNGTIMPFNIDDCYAEGISNNADSLADSKGGGFSLVSNGAALQDSEWFHMKIHHVGASVMGVKYETDCGSTKGMIVKVHSKEFLNILQGAYYFKEDGSLELIYSETFKNIEIGSTIKIRSIAWCRYGRSGKPCSTCYGKMISSLPYNRFNKRSAVPGLFFGSIFGEKTGQSILKTKHRIGNTSVTAFETDSVSSKYINTDGTFIYFNSDFIEEDKDPHVVLDRALYLELADYRNMESLDDLDESQIPVRKLISLTTKVKHPMFEEGFAIERPALEASVASRQARMTKSFIDFLKTRDVVEEGKTTKISLLGWDSKQPAYELPNINEDLDAYRARTEKFLTFAHLKGRANEKVTEEFHGEQFVDFWRVVQEQNKDANKIIYDILLWGCMAINAVGLDFGLPAADDDRSFISFSTGIINRGQGNPLMYGYQGDQLKGVPWRYIVKNRQPNILESYLQPLTYM